MKTRVVFEYFLPGTIQEISIYFSDFHLFGKHHPYMDEVIALKTQTPSTNRYLVKETLKLWNIIPMKPSYEVEVRIVESEKHIQYKSEVSKGVFLDIDYTFTENLHTHTIKIVETMVLKGYPILNSIFIQLLKKSRVLLFESIREKLLK